MSYNGKKNDSSENLEYDDMKIKSHLNTSLDLSGISVSEDLINRTLEAIKMQQAGQTEQAGTPVEQMKKVIPWNRYIRVAAGIAAAVIVVVVGYSAISNTNFGAKEDKSSYDAEMYTADSTGMKEDVSDDAAVKFGDTASSSDNETAEENSSAEYATEGTADIAAADTGADADQEAPLYTITASSAKEAADGKTNDEKAADEASSEDAKTAGGGTTGQTGNADTATNAVQPRTTAIDKSSVETALTFRTIFLSDPKQAQYIMITDETNNTSITLTDQKDILDFYTVMDQHQFSYNTDDSSEQNYKVEVKTPLPDEILYTMVIGNVITVEYEDADISSQATYTAADQVLLKQNLDEFYKKYNK
jgi:hypothetical protein